MSDTKPVVHYNADAHKIIMVGFSAMVSTIDHPSEFVNNGQVCSTSRVERLTDTGFETVNTIYVAMVRGESGWVLK